VANFTELRAGKRNWRHRCFHAISCPDRPPVRALPELHLKVESVISSFTPMRPWYRSFTIVRYFSPIVLARKVWPNRNWMASSATEGKGENEHENTHGADIPRSTGQHRPQD